jgi:hypothetical protein
VIHVSAASASSAAAGQCCGWHSPALGGRRTARLWQCTPQGSCVRFCVYICAHGQCTHTIADAPAGLALLPLQDGGTTTSSVMPMPLSCCRAQTASAVTTGSAAKAAPAHDGYHRGRHRHD